MARLYSCGFELAGTVAAMPTGYEIHAVSGAASMAIQSTTKRSGSYALQVGGSSALVSGTISRVEFIFQNGVGLGPFYARAYVYFVTFPSAENRIMALAGSAAASYWTVDASGVVRLYDEDGQVGANIPAISTGVWYRAELEHDGNGVGSADIVNLYIDGTLARGSSTRNVAQSIDRLWLGGNMNSEANTTGEWYFDDVAINNSAAGGNQTGLPGAGKIVHLWPNGDGDADTLVTRSSGATTPTGTDRGSNYKQLGADFDKPAPNDATDFLLLTATTSEAIVDCEAVSVAEIGATDTVTLVAVGGRVTAVTTTGSNWIPKIMSQAAGTKVSGSTVTMATATWQTHDDTAGVQQYKLTQYVDPQAGGAWTPALLDTMQIVAATTDGNPDTLVSAIWALVEYVEVNSYPVFATWQPKFYSRRKVK